MVKNSLSKAATTIVFFIFESYPFFVSYLSNFQYQVTLGAWLASAVDAIYS